MHPDGQQIVNRAPYIPWEKHRERSAELDVQAATVVKQFKLKEDSNERFLGFDLYKNYELRQFVEKELKREFKRGYAFYQFDRELEDIPDHKEIIFYYMVYTTYLVITILIVLFQCSTGKNSSPQILTP